MKVYGTEEKDNLGSGYTGNTCYLNQLIVGFGLFMGSVDI